MNGWEETDERRKPESMSFARARVGWLPSPMPSPSVASRSFIAICDGERVPREWNVRLEWGMIITDIRRMRRVHALPGIWYTVIFLALAPCLEHHPEACCRFRFFMHIQITCTTFAHAYNMYLCVHACVRACVPGWITVTFVQCNRSPRVSYTLACIFVNLISKY